MKKTIKGKKGMSIEFLVKVVLILAALTFGFLIIMKIKGSLAIF